MPVSSTDAPVDVLIIGAGASGAALAWSLADTRMNILCLEQGGWMDPEKYPAAGLDWEIRGFGDFSVSPNTRGRPEDYPVNDSDSPIAASMFNAVGGSTVLYAAHFPRFRPSDFRVRTLDGVADDWPLDYERLAPYYAENARMMGVAGLAGDPAYPPKEFPLPPVPLGKLGETLAGGFNTGVSGLNNAWTPDRAIGGDGAMLWAEGQRWTHPGFRTTVMETTGAGDSFNAGFLHRYLRGGSWEECLDFGNRCGALAVTEMGGTGAFRDRETLHHQLSGMDLR